MTVTRKGQLTAELQYLGDVVSLGFSPPTISSVKSRTGGFSYRFGTTTDPAGLSFPFAAHVRAGFWINHNGPQTTNTVRIFTWREQGSPNFSRVSWNPDTGLLNLVIQNITEDTVSAATVGFNTLDTWLHCGLHVHTGSPASVSFYLNGERCLHYDGDVAGFNVAELYACGGTGLFRWQDYAYVDDFYVDALSADEPDVAPPSKRFLFSLVNGAGVNAEFTPVGVDNNYQAVDDPGVPDEDATYNKALVEGLRDTFQTANITLPPDHVIRAAIPIALVKKTDAAGNQALKLHAFDGANYHHSGVRSLSTIYKPAWDRFPLQPDGTAWNESDFNAIQFGYDSDLLEE